MEEQYRRVYSRLWTWCWSWALPGQILHFKRLKKSKGGTRVILHG